MNRGFTRLRWIAKLEFAVVVASVAATAGVLLGQGAERFAASPPPLLAALFVTTDAGATAHSGRSAAFLPVDYAPTASLKGQTVVISRCAGPPAEP